MLSSITKTFKRNILSIGEKKNDSFHFPDNDFKKTTAVFIIRCEQMNNTTTNQREEKITQAIQNIRHVSRHYETFDKWKEYIDASATFWI